MSLPYSCKRGLQVNTLRNNDVVIMSKRRHFDVVTSKWRRFDVITTLLCVICAAIFLHIHVLTTASCLCTNQANPFRDIVYCHYKRPHPYYLLRPLKEEVIYLDPFVAVYHDIITDTQIDIIKAKATPQVYAVKCRFNAVLFITILLTTLW